MSAHTCHAHNCTRVVPPSMFACSKHWHQLRLEMRAAIWREYRRGQEIDKRPSLRYIAVQQLAIAELVFKPHDEIAAALAAPYLLKSEQYRQRAIEAGLGDPLQGLTP